MQTFYTTIECQNFIHACLSIQTIKHDQTSSQTDKKIDQIKAWICCSLDSKYLLDLFFTAANANEHLF